jgi:hypothetical protein
MELDEYRQGLVLIPPSLPPLLMEDFANVVTSAPLSDPLKGPIQT